MAYYNSNYLEGYTYTGEYQEPSYYNTHHVVPFHNSHSYSNFEPHTIDHNHSITYDAMHSSYDIPDPKLIEYTNSYDPYNSEMNYSMHSFSEPSTVVEYDPPTYQTQYFISYKKVTFNELNNQVYDPTPYDGINNEYDPTPYDGGYDQTITYGKPLPPSDQICYPRSGPKPASLSLDGFSYNSIPSPYGDNDSGSSSIAKPLEESESVEEKESDSYNEGTIVESIDLVKPTEFDEEEESNGEVEGALVEQYDTGNGRDIEGFNNGHDYPWLYYDHGYGDGRIQVYDKYDCDKQIVAQTQHGYGSDGVLNYCESILGYWPCLAKKNKETNELVRQNIGDTKRVPDLPKETDYFKTTAEYIFGSSVASGRDGIESYYRQQPCYNGQEMYYDKSDENSWIQKFSIF